MIRMIDRHAVHEMFKAKRSTKEIAVHFGVTRRTIQRIVKEPAVESADDTEARRQRGVGRPGVAEPLRPCTDADQ
jgi:IS30 family transposase